MKRREFIIALGGAAASLPLAARAQERRVWRIGFLSGKSKPNSLKTSVYGEFLRGMNDFGYIEGRDFVMEWRFVAGDFSRLPELAEPDSLQLAEPTFIAPRVDDLYRCDGRA
jgi:putative tryptophan/tyrosine transport system substrate-binding protein